LFHFCFLHSTKDLSCSPLTLLKVILHLF
jgi:hypothetical protein